MDKEISINELKACARDLNITMDLIPRIPIMNANKGTLIGLIKKVIPLIQPSDEFKPETKETLNKLKKPAPKPSKPKKKKRDSKTRRENYQTIGKTVSLRITELVCDNFDITYDELFNILTLENYKFTKNTVYVRRIEVLRTINILKKLKKLKEIE